MPAPRHLHLSDLELARAVADGERDARLEVRRRFTPVAIVLAKRICARIGHRGRRCSGLGCEYACEWIVLHLLDSFAGREAGEGRRARRALIVTWLRSGPRTDQFAPTSSVPAARGSAGW
jgi:hypothetical protein